MGPDPQDSRQEHTPFARYLEDLSAPHVGEMPEEEILESDEHPAREPLDPFTIDGVRFDQEVNWSTHEFGRTVIDPKCPHTLLRRGRDYVDIQTF